MVKISDFSNAAISCNEESHKITTPVCKVLNKYTPLEMREDPSLISEKCDIWSASFVSLEWIAGFTERSEEALFRRITNCDIKDALRFGLDERPTARDMTAKFEKILGENVHLYCTQFSHTSDC